MVRVVTIHFSTAGLLVWLSLISLSCLASDQTTIDGTVSSPQDMNALDIPLVSETGSTVSINSFKAPIRLVFFGFTYCPDICPLTLHKVASALRLLNRPVGDVDVIFISVDPKRDTPEILARYTDAFHEQIAGLSDNVNQLQVITQHFRTTFGYNLATATGDKPLPIDEYNALPVDSSYIPYHSSQIYVLNLNGEIVDLIGLGSDAELIAQTIENAINL
ncbi:MAG: SCO family protein [Arenicellaceae bacterium]|nr:SCO family protein [Arenicellaceae bacterium]